MQVFRDAIEKNGGPLPLAYYLQPDAGTAPDPGPLQHPKHIDLLNTRVDRRTFFESLLHDKSFAILNTFLVSGVSANAVRDEDGATALHIATASTLAMLDDDSLMPPQLLGMGTGNAVSDEDASHSTERVLNPPCPNQLILNFLIDNGAEVNAPMRNRQRQTPLMVAAARRNIKAAKLLLAKGADVHAQDASGRTTLSYAARYPLVLEALRVWMGEEAFMAAAVRERLLHVVCRTVGNHYAALYLIEQVRLDVNARDGPVVEGREGRGSRVSPHASPRKAPQSPLLRGPGYPSGSSSNLHDNMAAATTGPLASAAGSGGNTPLNYAVSTGDVALVKALLSKGADVHAANASGVTPLQLAQSQSQLGTSWRQYWRDELVLLLKPASAAAATVRRRRALHCECSPAKVKRLLTAFNNATPGPPREKLVEEKVAQYIWQMCTPMDCVQFACTAVLPHVFFYLCCCVLRHFFLLLCVTPLMYASYVGTQRRDSSRPRSRPLTGLGWCFGFVVAQGLCLPLFTTRYYYKYYSFELEEHAAISWWLIPSAIITFVCTVYLVLFSSPGVVTTTEGQRKGIYASLRNAKGGTYPKELLYGVDLRTMVKKPLRAQYCVQLQRVVLRFDQYCTYLSTVVGGGNQRAFFWTHVALLSLLSCFYHYAREYGRLMGRLSEVARTAGGGTGKAADDVLLGKLAGTPFATAEWRFGYMYTQVLLPVMILMNVYALYNQLCLMARNLTVFDLEHADDESSVYCFSLGTTAYSLYDHGMTANLREFFGWSSFTQVVYRVPQMNPYLQKIVEDFQRWQLTAGDGCGCGDDHGHSHGGSNNKQAAAAAGQVERIGPAEYGDDEANRTQEMLEARHLQALAAATAGGASAAVPSAAAAAQVPAHAAFASGAAHEGAEGGEGEEEDDGEYYEEDGAAGGAPAASVLAMQIFQQMVRSGSTDVGRGGDATAYGGGGGADAEMQRDWDEAVLQARKMFTFYRQSLGGQGEDD